MKIEFESVLFGLAFLVLALISAPKKEETAPAPDAMSQSAQEIDAVRTTPSKNIR